MERIFHDQAMNFLSDNNVLNKFQSDFRKNSLDRLLLGHTFMITFTEEILNGNYIFCAVFFKFFSEMCPQYMNEIYIKSNQNKTVTRSSSLKLF